MIRNNPHRPYTLADLLLFACAALPPLSFYAQTHIISISLIFLLFGLIVAFSIYFFCKFVYVKLIHDKSGKVGEIISFLLLAFVAFVLFTEFVLTVAITQLFFL